MRLFVAVDVDRDVAGRLGDCTQELQRRARAIAPRARISWVPADRLHVTVRFIGEVDERHAATITDALAPDLDLPAFTIGVVGVGVFPPRGAVRVVWAGLGVGVDRLSLVEAEVSARLSRCGIRPDDRPFRPHLTLARVKEPAGLRSAPLVEGLVERNFGRSAVDAITLFQSRLSATGAAYQPLRRIRLRDQSDDH